MLTTLAFLFAAQAQAPAGPIELVCAGGGAANKPDTQTAWATDNWGNSAQATVQGRRSVDFADQVDLRIDGPNSRVRLPRKMLPILRGGDGGWFKLKDLEVTATYIKGTATVNFMNNPKLYIDRRTGSISIEGKAEHYTGQCERVTAGTATKF